MAEKSSPSNDGPPDAEDSTPRREGNPWERQRAFNIQRRAVLRPGDDEDAPPESARPDDADDESQGDAPPADAPAEYKTRLAEYRRRQRRMPRPTAEAARAPEGKPDPAEDDEAS
jgi:hypothetical protein